MKQGTIELMLDVIRPQLAASLSKETKNQKGYEGIPRAFDLQLADIRKGLELLQKKDLELFNQLAEDLTGENREEIVWADPFGWKEEPYFRWELAWFSLERDADARYDGRCRKCKYLPIQSKATRERVEAQRKAEKAERERQDEEKWIRENPELHALRLRKAREAEEARKAEEARRLELEAKRAAKERRRQVHEARVAVNKAKKAYSRGDIPLEELEDARGILDDLLAVNA